MQFCYGFNLMFLNNLPKIRARPFLTYRLIKNYNSNFQSVKLFVNKNMNTKPPNILVYTGSNCPSRFKRIEESILKCLKTDSYLVYHLLASEILKNPWMENSQLLVISSDIVDNAIAAAFETYFENFGNILLVCSKFNGCFVGNKCYEIAEKDILIPIDFKSIGKVFMLRGKYSYSSNGTVLFQDDNNKPVIQKVIFDRNMLIMSEIYIDRDPGMSCELSQYNSDNRLSILKHIFTKEFGLEANDNSTLPELSPGYFFCDKELEITNILKKLKLKDIAFTGLIFHECRFKNLNNSDVNVPVYFHHENLSQPFEFDKNLYFSSLHSNVYGHYVVYFPVITSTMEAAMQLSEYDGIVIAAGCQISGRGRGSNKWISPKGCAMFTLHFTLSLNSNLGKRISLLQHIASLAVVQGVKSQQIYKDLELKIKWPNDIYYGKTKIGGLIVSTVIEKNSAHVKIGWGVNVSNNRPTTCLNNIIDGHNTKNASDLPHLHIEQIIAYTISQMENFVKEFTEFGPESFFKNYYLNWMHNNQRVTLTNLNQQGTIISVDEFGFLKIKADSGEILVFQPDGNRFDIMKNLIHTA